MGNVKKTIVQKISFIGTASEMKRYLRFLKFYGGKMTLRMYLKLHSSFSPLG